MASLFPEHIIGAPPDLSEGITMVYELVAQRSGSLRPIAPLAVLTVAILVATPSISLAERRQFGAKVGPAFTGIVLAEDDGQDYHPRIAATGGGFITWPLSQRLAMQFEAMSSAKGTRLEEARTNFAQTLMLRYFEMPVLVRIAGPKLPFGAAHFLAGPFFGIRTSAKAQYSMLVDSVIVGERNRVEDDVERFESGLIAGVGLDIGKYLVVDGRYSHGLTNVNHVEGTHFTNHGMTFMLGVRF